MHNIYSYECNPLQKDICINNLKKINHNGNIIFCNYGLGEIVSTLEFYPYICDNIGASSFYKRIDFDKILGSPVFLFLNKSNIDSSNFP